MDIFFVAFIGCFVAAAVIYYYDPKSKMPERLVLVALVLGVLSYEFYGW